MAVSLKIRMQKTNTTKQKTGKFPIVLQVTWNREVRRIRLGINSFIKEWDFQNHQFNEVVPNAKSLNRKLVEAQSKAQRVCEAYFSNIPFDYKSFVEKFKEPLPKEKGINEFCIEISDEFLRRGKANSAHYYRYTGIAVLKVAPNDIPLSQFNAEWLREIEDYYQSRGVKCFNYMVHLRSVYNKAVERRLVDFKKNPFKNPYTNPYGYDFSKLKKSRVGQMNPNRIKDLTKEELLAVRNYEPRTKDEAKYLAIWFFSFYNFGVNLIDIAMLQHTHIRNGRWFYRRSKTGVGLKNGKPLLPESLAIIKEHDTKGKYIFDILNGYDQDEKSKTDRVRAYSRYISNACSRVSKRLELNGYFTYYSARYSSATLALNAGADKNTVSHLLDHENLSTIDNYVGRADEGKVLEAMKILRLV